MYVNTCCGNKKQKQKQNKNKKQKKIYPRKQCLCPGISPQGDQLELSDESVYRVS